MLSLYFLTLVLEPLIYRPFWRFRKTLSFILALSLPPITLFITLQNWGVVALILLISTGFRIVNLFRIVVGRSHEKHLYNRAIQTSAIFIVIGAILAVIIYGNVQIDFGIRFLQSMVVLQLSASIAILFITLRNIRKSKHELAAEFYTDKELPSVTVAIPARNETTDLEDCIRSLLASDYPKLEIIVLDDCSHDRTADIIKQFARQGVRFVQGDEPKDRWLAKNQAYEKLAQEASGKYILFCGVDTRFGPRAIRQLFSSMLSRKKIVASVMPRRLLSTPSSSIIQPMRYWWELALPRRWIHRPPVLSTCWVIKKEFFKKCGGFSAVSFNILPERYFAREAIKQDGYSFMRAYDELDIQTVKQVQDQRETAIRMRYPQVRKRLEIVFLMSIGMPAILLGPFIAIFASALLPIGYIYLILAVLSCFFLIATHMAILWVSNPANIPLAVVNFPFVILVEIALGLESMWKYEFSTVDWKGRNICIPVMHVTPKLPEVKN